MEGRAIKKHLALLYLAAGSNSEAVRCSSEVGLMRSAPLDEVPSLGDEAAAKRKTREEDGVTDGR